MDKIKDNTEKFVTVKEAALQLGLPYWKLNRAVNSQLVPSYTFFNKRRLVLISEVMNVIKYKENLS